MGKYGKMLFGIVIITLSISLIVWSFVNTPQKQHHQDLIIKEEEKEKPRITAKDNELDLLARAVHAEAKGEPYEGQVAVAAVILNRVAHPEFPNSIAGVIFEPLAFQIVANGSINKPADDVAIRAAHEAINGLDPTNGALYFFNPTKTNNRWIRSRPAMKTIGKHIFAS